MSAILQGVYKRALQGNASSADGKAVGSFAEWFADRAWEIVNSTDSLSVRTNPPVLFAPYDLIMAF
jgi:hypothetical protein